ncbi:MAG TPA: monofunctional biosynthetic peptidoglycan transglycosylase [Bacteroidia bacterium]|nr:monofunctional biosynthetic peptidoglycan transglycosylase [Bacteroidia bacterium]HNT81003.1 monofunctional biosynthetic peptidoglycan transglycosylase [Bacteroidia bacterium]
MSKYIRNFISWLFGMLIVFLISSIGITVLYRFVNPPVSPLMIIRMIEQKSDGKEMKLVHDWRSIDQISSSMILAVITAEDQNFEDHYGFDLKAIEKAMQHNKRGKRIKGASTISQQTAKNVFLWPSRSWIRKGLEVYFTFLIEIFWSKERIMEVYLNIIEMGPGIYGIEAASNYYFKKPAIKLSNQQAATIAAILPNPIRWSASKPSPYIIKKRNWIVRHMRYIDRPNL